MKRGVAMLFVIGIVVAACAGSDGGPGTGSTASTSAVPATTTSAGPATSIPDTTVAIAPPSTSGAPTVTTTAVSRFIQAPEFDTWAAVLASLPVGEYDRSAAEDHATGLRVAGVGVALSDDYPSLNPGYWVVFAAPGKDSFDADYKCYQLQNRIPDCYRRYFGVDPAQRLSRETGHLLALDGDEGVYRLVDIVSGEIVRTIGIFGGDGRYPGEPQLDVGRWHAYYSVGVEDSWFSCESSDGSIIRLDLETARDDEIADGTAPALNDDASKLAYLAASECYPDPQEPQFVLAPFDTIVVRNLDTGRETRSTIPLTVHPEGYPNELTSLVWGRDDTELYVLDLEHRIRRFTAGGVGGDVISQLDDGGFWRLVGYDAGSDRLLVHNEKWTEGRESNRFVWLDPATGTLEELLAVNGHASAAFDAGGDVVGIAVGSMLIVDGEQHSLDVDVVFFDW